MGVAAVLVVTSACGTPLAEPSSNGPALSPHFPLALREARNHFEKDAMDCVGPADPSPQVAEWICRGDEAGNQGRLRVGIQADTQGVTQLVGVADGYSPESAAFLTAAVAGFVVPVDQRNALDRWSMRHAEAGATRAFGNVNVELDPESDERWLIIVLPTAGALPRPGTR